MPVPFVDDAQVIAGPGGDPEAISQVQDLLNKVGYYAVVTGAWNDQTDSAVRSFQIKSGLPPTGLVDSATMNELAAAAQTDVHLPETWQKQQDPITITGKVSGGTMFALALGAWFLWNRKKKSESSTT